MSFGCRPASVCICVLPCVVITTVALAFLCTSAVAMPLLSVTGWPTTVPSASMNTTGTPITTYPVLFGSSTLTATMP